MDLNLDGVRRVIFGLDTLHRTRPAYVFYVEGEKDARTLHALPVAATTHAGGVKGWRADYVTQLIACGIHRVYVIPDHDRPGHEFAATLAADCHAAGLKVRIVALPGLHDGAYSSTTNRPLTPRAPTHGRESPTRPPVARAPASAPQSHP